MRNSSASVSPFTVSSFPPVSNPCHRDPTQQSHRSSQLSNLPTLMTRPKGRPTTANHTTMGPSTSLRWRPTPAQASRPRRSPLHIPWPAETQAMPLSQRHALPNHRHCRHSPRGSLVKIMDLTTVINRRVKFTRRLDNRHGMFWDTTTVNGILIFYDGSHRCRIEKGSKFH